METIDENLHQSQFLAQAVMQLTGDATAFVILRGNHSCGNALHICIEHLELARLTVKISEDSYLCAEEFGDDGNEQVVYRPMFVALEAVRIGNICAGNEDDGGVLKARVVANAVRQIEAVEPRHVDVRQDHGYFIAQEIIEGFVCGTGANQIFA